MRNEIIFFLLLLLVGCASKPPVVIVPGNPVTPVTPVQPAKSYSVSGNQILESGKPIRLVGINWFGGETETLCPHGLWLRKYRDMLNQIKSLGFNAIRLPFSNDVLKPGSMPVGGIDLNINPDLKGLTGLQIFDRIISYAQGLGLYVILDRHRPTQAGQSESWEIPAVPESKWISDWVAIATRYKGYANVIGYDLHNEPNGSTQWQAWSQAADRAARAINAAVPGRLIIVQGVQYAADGSQYWWGGNLSEVSRVHLNLPNVVYSPHDYPLSVAWQDWFGASDYPSNLPEVWDRYWGYISKQGAAPILVGEFGTKLQTDSDRQWFSGLCSYIKSNKLNFTFWALNPNSGDTGGLLNDDWTTINQSKLAILKSCF